MQVEKQIDPNQIRNAPLPQDILVEGVKDHENSPTPIRKRVLLGRRMAPIAGSETSRQRITTESLENTHRVYLGLINEGEETLELSHRLKAEAELKHGEAKKELESAESIRAEADAYFERITEKAQAKKEAATAYQENLLNEVHQQIKEELAEAETSRAEADSLRERSIAEAQQQAEEIVNLAKTAAEEVHQQAEEKLSVAETSRAEADSLRERAIAEAQQQAEEIVDLAKTAAELEGQTIKEKLVQEAQKALARLAQTASQAETEAQKLYTDAASLEAISKEALAQAEAQLGQRTPVEELEEISNSEAVSEPAPKKRKGWLKD